MATRVDDVRICRDPSKSERGYWRAIVRLHVDIESCLLYHCGNSGYRAQYYVSPMLGDAANRKAVEVLCAAIDSQLRVESDADFLLSSLRSNSAKAWIYQGTWCRRSAFDDRLLEVPRWLLQLDSSDKNRRKLARYSTLVPLQEHRLELKGAYITLDGSAELETHKPNRARQIHELGFT